MRQSDQAIGAFQAFARERGLREAGYGKKCPWSEKEERGAGQGGKVLGYGGAQRLKLTVCNFRSDQGPCFRASPEVLGR